MNNDNLKSPPSPASAGSVAKSAFGEWFEAQFPNNGRFAELSDEALSDMAEDGRDAEQELRRRDMRREQERIALYAWQASTQVPRK
jgi:hypothetical protein